MHETPTIKHLGQARRSLWEAADQYREAGEPWKAVGAYALAASLTEIIDIPRDRLVFRAPSTRSAQVTAPSLSTSADAGCGWPRPSRGCGNVRPAPRSGAPSASPRPHR
jgi:hypothetical protein